MTVAVAPSDGAVVRGGDTVGVLATVTAPALCNDAFRVLQSDQPGGPEIVNSTMVTHIPLFDHSPHGKKH